MKKLWVLLLSAVCSFFLIVASQAQTPTRSNTEAVGIVLLSPDRKSNYDPIGSGIYLGQGIILTNWHIANNAALLILEGVDFKNEDQILNYQVGNGDSRIDNWICDLESTNSSQNEQTEYTISTENTEDCIPYNLTKWQAFRPSNQNRSASMPSVPIEELLFLNRDLEVAVAKLNPQKLEQLKISPPCIETKPIKIGENLIVKSHAYGHYPAIKAIATVKTDRPMLLTDPDPRVPVKNRYAAISIIATLPQNQADAVGPGSSGGPVFNQQGNLVGLVWTGQDLPDGTKEVWITPASVWLPQLQQAGIPDRDLEKVLHSSCSV